MITQQQALEALDNMDDYARMAGIDAKGPREVLRQYIQQSAPQAVLGAELKIDPNDRRSDLGMPLSANAPLKCPITRRPFFMVIEHPELGWVPTYGGPYDSYTIPHMEGKPDEPFHERELTCHHFDHDAGYWLDDETIPMRVINEQVLNDLLSAAPQPQQEQSNGR